jgi:hypothetical protein
MASPCYDVLRLVKFRVPIVPRVSHVTTTVTITLPAEMQIHTETNETTATVTESVSVTLPPVIKTVVSEVPKTEYRDKSYTVTTTIRETHTDRAEAHRNGPAKNTIEETITEYRSAPLSFEGAAYAEELCPCENAFCINPCSPMIEYKHEPASAPLQRDLKAK